MENQGFLSAHLDFFGFTASVACAIHCAAIPLILAVSSISSLGFLENPVLEGGILLLGLIIALASLLPAYFTKHHRISPMVLMLAGFLTITAGKFVAQSLHEGIITVGGAILVATAHYLNWKLARKLRQTM